MDMDEALSLPGWLTPAAWIFLGVSLASAAVIAYQIYGRGRRSRSHAMDIAWIVGALYLGPLALFMFQRAGQPTGSGGGAGTELRRAEHARATLRGGLMGGAASAIAHVIGVPFVVLTGLTIAGQGLWAMVAVITVLAIALLIAFEYAVRDSQASPGAAVTLIAAVVTIVFFDVGMLGWMLLLHFNGLMPAVTDVTFVFLMQVGLVLGFIAGSPAISLLLRRGVKVPA